MRLARVLLCTFGLAAQDAGFRTQSRLVLVPVAVTDSRGRPVDTVDPASFRLVDEGAPQPVMVDTFATGVAPLSLIIAVQTSGISAAALGKVRKVGAMVQPLITGERGVAAVMRFDERVEFLQDFTSDGDAIARAFAALTPGADRESRMLDAVTDASRRLHKHGRSRRVVLLISESKDRGSETKLEHAIEAAQRAEVAVYALTYSAQFTAWTTRPADAQAPPAPPPLNPREANKPSTTPRPPATSDPSDQMHRDRQQNSGDLLAVFSEIARLGKTNSVRALASATGGEQWGFTRLRGLEEALERFGAEVHSQYVLSFTPPERASGFRRLEVQVLGGRSYRVRARPGYWAD
jgi:VWFA-related protein